LEKEKISFVETTETEGGERKRERRRLCFFFLVLQALRAEYENCDVRHSPIDKIVIVCDVFEGKVVEFLFKRVIKVESVL
jgi:hypothetical protein